MKKLVLILTAMLLAGTAARATDQKGLIEKDGVEKRYRQKQPIVFMQGGVKFFIFPDGQLDFRIQGLRSRSGYTNVDWRWDNGRYNTPGSRYGYFDPYHDMVRYDYYGRLKRVKNNAISYNRYDQVRRIGNVDLRYNHRGLLTQVGGLKIYYHKNGKIRFTEGSVHHIGCGYCGVNGCSMTHGSYQDQDWDHDDHNHDRQDQDHYRDRRRKQ